MKRLILSVVLLFIACMASRAQVGITGVSFLQFNDHARSKALGGATVALAPHTGGMHVNPAAFGGTKSVKLAGHLGREVNPGFSEYQHFYMPSLTYADDKWAFGYQLMYYDLDELIRTDASGNALGTFSGGEQAHTLSIRYRLNPYIRLGAGLSFIRSKLVMSGVSAADVQPQIGKSVALDLGVHGEYPYRINEHFTLIPSAGWSLTDFGSKMKYAEHVEADPLPMKMRGGIGLKLEYTSSIDRVKMLENRTPVSLGFYQSVDKLMARVDHQTGKALGPFGALFGSWDPYQRDMGRNTRTYTLGEQINHRGGLELTVFEMVSFRQGYIQQAKVNGHERSTMFGIGLHYKYVYLDYVLISSDNPFRSDQEVEYWNFTARIPLKLLEGS